MRKLVLLFAVMTMFYSCAGKRPENLGLENKWLAQCPPKRNCVNSQSAGEAFFIEPFKYEGTREAAIKKLKKTMESFDRITLIEEDEKYMRYEAKTAIMGFVDDLEFYFAQGNIIHIRSAARLGYFDFGVNRKRVEKLRGLFSSK